MSFDPTPITSPTIARDGDTLALSWDSSAPAGSIYQVYLDRSLAWHGTQTTVRLPWPSGPIQFEIGVVDAADAATDYSASLPGGFAERAELTWVGGTYLSPTIESFAICGPASPGGPVDYSKTLASVPAYEDGIITDGYGVGGYGEGGWGESASSYSWTSGVLANGSWTFAVVPIDAAGDRCADPTTATVVIEGPPQPPARNSAGVRLTYTYSASTNRATLGWLASPG